MLAQKRLLAALSTVFFLVLVWSVINPKERMTWFLESVPALIGFVLLVLTYRSFPLTNLLYVLICIHAIILMVGGHYTYAEVPLFDWIKEVFGFSRNHYDRLGHFAQGFVPAVLTREILIRTSPLKPGKWLVFLVVCVCLAVSATYELVEWSYAAGEGANADSFLGSQGDIWDAQKDMLFAVIGSVCAILFLSRVHNKQLEKMGVVLQ